MGRSWCIRTCSLPVRWQILGLLLIFWSTISTLKYAVQDPMEAFQDSESTFVPREQVAKEREELVKRQSMPLIHMDKVFTRRFQANLDFSHTPGQQPIIPHIIHQLWPTELIPKFLHDTVKKWRELHPSWEYWFWTMASVRKLIATHYGKYLTMFDHYQTDLQRIDAARYFIIHHYGGLYVDIDVEALKSLDNFTYNYNCLFSHETEEHMYILRHQTAPNIVNDILACRANHPLYTQTIDSLLTYASKFEKDPSKSTGDLFIDKMFFQYNRNRTAHVQGWQRGSDVTVVPSKYFLPTFDIGVLSDMVNKCGMNHVWQLVVQGQMLCKQRHRDKFRNQVSEEEAYTNPRWIHAYTSEESWKRKDLASVFDVVPDSKNPVKLI